MMVQILCNDEQEAKYLLLLLKGSALELSARLKKASNQLHRELEKTVLNGGKPELPESYVLALN